jgi:hypothetical protein
VDLTFKRQTAQLATENTENTQEGHIQMRLRPSLSTETLKLMRRGVGSRLDSS